MRQSWALTLYTLWQLQQLHRHDVFERTMEDHNLATLVAFSYNDPHQIPKITDRYLDQFTPMVASSQRDWSRYAAMIAAHQRMIPTEPH